MSDNNGIVPQLFTKRAGWNLMLTWDFSDFGEWCRDRRSIVSAVVTCPNNDMALTIGSPMIAQPQVQVQVSGGTLSLVYAVNCQVFWSGPPSGLTRDWPGELEIVA